jgi:integrase
VVIYVCLFFVYSLGKEKSMKQIIGDCRVYSRHSADCAHKNDPTHLKCNCRKWLQYQLDKKTIQVSAETRSMAGVKLAAEKKTAELRGEVPTVAAEPDLKTVASAVKDWLEFREKDGLGNTKPESLGRKLTEWCNEHSITFLHQITSERVIQFRSSLNYRSRTSHSFQNHWSIIAAFFGWATLAKLIAANPVPPFKTVKVKVPEVKVPTLAEIEKVIAATTGVEKLFLLTMRHSGVALLDCTLLDRSKLVGNLIKGTRSKSEKRYRVRIPEWLASTILALPGDKWFVTEKLSPRATADYRSVKLKRIASGLGLTITAHKFRHFFISEQLAAGVPVGDVSKMVGTSPQMIAKTYEHWIKEGEERLDAVQAEVWLAQGLDKDGNQKATTVQ